MAKALQILEHLARSERPQGVTGLASALELRRAVSIGRSPPRCAWVTSARKPASLKLGEIGSDTMAELAAATGETARLWQPVHNPIANLVYCAHGGCTDTVIVDGKILMRGGKVLTLNEHDLYEEAQDRAKSLIKRTGLEDVVKSIWPMH